MTSPHDIDLGPKPDDHERHRLLFEGKRSPLLLAILHYLRDEAAFRIGEAADNLRVGMEKSAHMELGAHEWLIQVFTKLNELRNTPPAIEPDESQAE